MILRSAGIELSDVRLLRHKDSRAAKGRSPYELWRDDRARFDVYQSTQRVTDQTKLNARYWASFVAAFTGETLFVGLYSLKTVRILDRDLPMPHTDGVDRAGSCNVYDIDFSPVLSDLAGRLVIDWGGGARAWIQRPDRQDKKIVELRKQFREPDFPGFLNFIQPLSTLQTMPQSWEQTLKASRGVYLLTCPRTREQYVGSATGQNGFWHRWQQYASSGHGGNVGLKSRDPSDYQVSILEVAGTAVTDNEILAMEARWKTKLQSIEMGLNKN